MWHFYVITKYTLAETLTHILHGQKSVYTSLSHLYELVEHPINIELTAATLWEGFPQDFGGHSGKRAFLKSGTDVRQEGLTCNQHSKSTKGVQWS